MQPASVSNLTYGRGDCHMLEGHAVMQDALGHGTNHTGL